MSEEAVETRLARLEERLNATERALTLQASEYERRLEALNGEAEQLRNMQARYVPREVWETGHEKIVSEHEELEEKTTTQALMLSQVTARLSVIDSGLTWVSRLLAGAVLLALITALFAVMKPIPVK